MNIAEVKKQLSFYKANYPLKKREIQELSTYSYIIDILEDDTLYAIKIDNLVNLVSKIQRDLKKGVGTNGSKKTKS